jgi:hypothetical protein
MTEHKTSVTGPVIHCNETHVPDNGGAAGIKPEGSMASYPSKDQGCFRGAQTAGELTASQSGSGGPVDHEYLLRKTYPKHGGEAAEIHGPLKAKFNGARK